MSDDPESPGPRTQRRLLRFRMVFDQGFLTPEIVDNVYAGSGTENNSYIIG
jgi:hypothetical protein